MAQPTFGLTITQVDNEPRSAVAADLSTIGLVVTAPEANVATYPANTPVLINSSDDVAVAALGGTGTIRHQIDLINAQLSGFAASARIVIVRVDEGVDDDATMVNLIEGIAALEDAESMLGVAPRLIAVPGYTHQQATPATANPVVAALTGTLEKLVGVAFITGPHDSLQGYTDWRETFSSERLIPVETWVKAGVNPDTVDSAPAILGALVALDNSNGGVPSKSAANRPIQGIVDVNRPIPFSTVDGNTEGQQILALNGGIIVRGEAGSVTSLGTGGFTFVGTDTAGEDDLWRFYNVKRTRDYIHLMFLRTLRIYLGRFNLTKQTIEAILQTMTLALRDLEADGHILGFKIGFEAEKNNVGNLRLGNFSLYFKAEEPPVLRRLDIESYRYAPALDAMLENLIASAA
jgi:phage tail sheath protein FI